MSVKFREYLRVQVKKGGTLETRRTSEASPHDGVGHWHADAFVRSGKQPMLESRALHLNGIVIVRPDRAVLRGRGLPTAFVRTTRDHGTGLPRKAVHGETHADAKRLYLTQDAVHMHVARVKRHLRTEVARVSPAPAEPAPTPMGGTRTWAESVRAYEPSYSTLVALARGAPHVLGVTSADEVLNQSPSVVVARYGAVLDTFLQGFFGGRAAELNSMEIGEESVIDEEGFTSVYQRRLVAALGLRVVDARAFLESFAADVRSAPVEMRRGAWGRVDIAGHTAILRVARTDAPPFARMPRPTRVARPSIAELAAERADA